MNSSKEVKIFFQALLIRAIFLVAVICSGEKMYSGFADNTFFYDDYRYEQGAMEYAQTAEHLIDPVAFTSSYWSVHEWVHLDINPFKTTLLWNFYCAIIVKLTHCKYSIRLTCILLSSLSIIVIYKFANRLYDEFVATRTAYIMAYLPYFVIFSCFPYKDHLIMLLTFTTLYIALKTRLDKRIDKKSVLVYIISFLILFLLRSGLTVLLVLATLVLAYGQRIKKQMSPKMLLIVVIGIAFLIVAFVKSYDDIIFKSTYYLGRKEGLSGLSIASIKSIGDIWKLPITYLYSIISPIDLSAPIESWLAIVQHINIIMTPIAVGAFLYFFIHKDNRDVDFILLAIYLVPAVISIGIFRHYYSALPIPIMYAVSFREKMTYSYFAVWMFSSLIYVIALVIYYCFL